MTAQTPNPDGTTSGMTGVPAAPVSQAPAPVTSPQPQVLNSDVYAPDGKRWKDKFYGYEGAIGKIQKDAATAAGAYDQTIADLQRQLQVKDSQLASLQTGRAQEQERLESIPELEQRIAELQGQVGLVDKYRALTEYPDLLNVQVEETIPATEEGGEPTTRTVNPLIALVESSNLPPDQLKAQMAQLAKLYRTPAEPQPPTTTDPVTLPSPDAAGPPAVPSPATPTDQNSLEYWQARAAEAHDRLISGDVTARHDERDAWEKIRELKKAATT